MIIDQFGRKFPYLRLSVTDMCNFRCEYCLPNGYQKTNDTSFLAPQEIIHLVAAFAELGVQKVRLTGGEPTVRKDLTQIAGELSQISGITTIALTTNGYNLKEKAQAFYDAGISALNVSVDSLNCEKFHRITGHDKLPHVLEGIAAARTAGFRKIKLNAVLLKGVNDDDLAEFLKLAQREDLSVRFIELMQTGDNRDYFQKHHLSAEIIKSKLLEKGFTPALRRFDAGPAVEFVHADYRGSVGLIAPYSKDFCKSCNRLRVTSRGGLRLCLFGEHGYDLRPLLQHKSQKKELQTQIKKLLRFKSETHFLGQGVTGITPHLASLGG